jgi:hypothetical protein
MGIRSENSVYDVVANVEVGRQVADHTPTVKTGIARKRVVKVHVWEHDEIARLGHKSETALFGCKFEEFIWGVALEFFLFVVIIDAR